jgi:hypothetical protein
MSSPAVALSKLARRENECAYHAGVDRADAAWRRNDLRDLAKQEPHRDDRERKMLTDRDQCRPEGADRGEHFDLGAQDPPVPLSQHLNGAGDAGGEDVQALPGASDGGYALRADAPSAAQIAMIAITAGRNVSHQSRGPPRRPSPMPRPKRAIKRMFGASAR